LALTALFGWLKHFREKRRRENLGQGALLKQELIQIAWAILVIVILMGFVLVLGLWILR